MAEAPFIGAETVRDHLRRYVGQGRPGIGRLAYVGHAPGLGAAQAAALAAELDARLHLTAKSVCEVVVARLGLVPTPHAMLHLRSLMEQYRLP